MKKNSMASASLGLLTQLRPPPPALLAPSSQCGTHPASSARPLFPCEGGRRRRGPRPPLAFIEANGEGTWKRYRYNQEDEEEEEEKGSNKVPYKKKNYVDPCELYVCNLPSSFEVGDLARLFGPFGNVTAVLVARNPSTGRSRGAAYVTLGSLIGAKKAVAALEGSEVGGREIRVRYAVEMEYNNTKIDEGRWWQLKSKMVTNQIYEGRHKLYAGNLDSSLGPEDVRAIFSEFGTVVSAMLVKDCRTGRPRSYAFVTYDTETELEAALSVNGKSIAGRVMAVRRLKDDWIHGRPINTYR